LATSTYEDLGLVDAEDVYQNESLARQHESSTSSSAEPMESTNVALYENVGSSIETHRHPVADIKPEKLPSEDSSTLDNAFMLDKLPTKDYLYDTPLSLDASTNLSQKSSMDMDRKEIAEEWSKLPARVAMNPSTPTASDVGGIKVESYDSEGRRRQASSLSSIRPMESTDVLQYENVGSSTETHRDPTASDTGGIDVESYDSVGKFLSGTFNGSRNTPVSSQVQMHVTNADHQYEEVNAENQNSYSRRDTNFSPTEESKYEELQ